MAGITMKSLCKRYGKVSVIENLELEIKDQEFMVLVGPSGCGKSTILRMIAGLEEISDGEMTIGDRVVNKVPPKDRDVAMVFQSYALYPHMTVRENISFGLKVRKTPKAEIDRLVNDAAASLGLENLLDRKPKALSGGQRQRVALGRAMVRQPSVFLFDEPLSNLDAKLRVQMRAEISSLQNRLKITSVYVTHDQVEAMTMGHRICVLNGGYIQQVGTPLELYRRPKNLFVARFIGTPPMNIMDGQISEDGRLVHMQGFDLKVKASLFDVTNHHRGRKVAVGVRPEHLTALDEPEQGAIKVPGRVKVVEPLGHEVIVHCMIGEESVTAKFDPDHIPLPDTDVDLYLYANQVHLFDQETEKRLEA